MNGVSFAVWAYAATTKRSIGWWVAIVSGLSLACGRHGLQTSDASNAAPQPTAEPALVLGAPIAMTDPRIGVMGRTVGTAAGLQLGYPGVTIRTCFTGAGLALVGSSNNGRSRLAVVVNGSVVGELTLPQTAQEIQVWRAPAQEVGSGTANHCVDLVHQTETWIGISTLSTVRVAGELVQYAAFPQRKLLFVGDSVTCGEAVTRKPTCSKDATWWDANASYGALTAKRLSAQYQLVCYGGRGLVRDWQGRSDTLNAPQFFPLAIPDERHSPADLNAYVPDAVIVSLGTNDFNLSLGAFPAREQFVQTYVRFVRTLLTAYPRTSVFLTDGAIVVDDADSRAKSVLRDYIQAVVAQLASTNVAFLPATHQPGDTCDSHPTDAQHVEMAAEVATAIATKLGW